MIAALTGMALSRIMASKSPKSIAPYYLLKLNRASPESSDIPSFNKEHIILHADNYLYHQLNAQKRENDLTRHWLLSYLQQSIHTRELTDDNYFFLKQWCQLQIESPGSSWYTQIGYRCLIELDPAADPFTQIERLSAAQDRWVKPDSLDAIEAIVIEKDTQEAEELLKVKADEHLTEQERLIRLTRSVNEEIKARAYYRLSLMKRYGRSYASEKKQPNLNESLKYFHEATKASPQRLTNPIHLAFIINEAYVNPAKTALASLLLYANANTFYHIHIVMDPSEILSEKSRRTLSSLQAIRHYKIDFTEVPETILESYAPIIHTPSTSKRTWPRLIFFKLMLEKVFPQLDRLIVLDADILVQNDLQTLWSQPTEERNAISAALDPKVTHMIRHRANDCPNLPPSYVNSGVLVLNLKKLRALPVQSMLKNAMNNKCDFFFPEQDLINLTFHSDITYLAQRWNTLPTDIDDAPWIIHYMNEKPWHAAQANTAEAIRYQKHEQFAQNLINKALRT